MSRFKLLLTTDAVGGVWTYSLDLARALAAADDVAVCLAVLGPSPDAEQLDAAAAIPGLQVVNTHLPLDWLADEPRVLSDAGQALADLARRVGVDLVQLHAPALAARARFDVPVVSVVHSCLATWWKAVKRGPLPADFAWRAELTGDGLRASDLVVAPTRAFAHAVRDAYDLAGPPEAVHNGRTPLCLAEVPQDHAAFTAGRLWDEGKNVAAFDWAAALASVPFRAAGPLAGPNGAQAKLEHAVPLGRLDEASLMARLAVRPVFVSTALYEPFGLTVLEAAQAGCALVLADIPTFRELWSDAALFVAPTHAEAIAAAVDRLITYPDTRAQLATAAQERAARYTPAATATAMLGHYHALLRTQRKVAA